MNDTGRDSVAVIARPPYPWRKIRQGRLGEAGKGHGRHQCSTGAAVEGTAVLIGFTNSSTQTTPMIAITPASTNALVKAPLYCTMKPVTAGPIMPAQLAII